MQGDLFSGDIVKVAIERLRTFEPPEGYYLAFSGGKDSVTIKALADEAGVKYDAHYHLVPVDPPELIKFIREQHPDVEIDRCGKGLVQLVAKKGYPTRMHRWCCAYFKELGGKGRMTITGVRWAESARRKKRPMIDASRKKQVVLNVIVDWLDSDVWGYIRSKNIPYCKLYDEGWKRLGCVGCPMVRKAQQEIARWPKVMDVWRRGIFAWYKQKQPVGWSSPQALWEAWLDRDRSLVGDMREDECILFGSFGSEANDD